MTALFVAFSMITVPAYVALSTRTDDVEDVDMKNADFDIYDDGPYFQPTVHTNVMNAGAPRQGNPISGLFQRARMRMM